MIEIAELRERAEKLISECHNLIDIFEAELKEMAQVSFDKVKEIEQVENRLFKKGIMDDDLKRLKLKSVKDLERKKSVQELANNFTSKLEQIFKDGTKTVLGRSEGNRRIIIRRREDPVNYERPLGSKGNTNLEDYLIPVIKLMRKGCSHEEAFHKVKDALDVRYTTVHSQCTRGLGISLDSFLSLVESGEITTLLQQKYSDKYHLIKSELSI